MRPTVHFRSRHVRVLVGAMLAAALLSACTLNNPYDNDKTPASKAVADLSPDTAAAVQAVAVVRDAIASITVATHLRPGLRAGLSPVLKLHQAQLAALSDAVPDQVDTHTDVAVPVLPRDRSSMLQALSEAESHLLVQFLVLAAKADSGPFARLLGAMAAGAEQHWVALRRFAGIAISPRTITDQKLAGYIGTTDDRPGDSAASVEALQAALAGEHAAVYLDGVYGAQASKSRQPALFKALQAAYHAHRELRDELTVMIADRGAQPVAAKVAYELPAALATTAELNDAALTVERRIVETYGQLVENTAGAERRWALVALDNAAVRQLEFRGTPEMFPSSTT